MYLIVQVLFLCITPPWAEPILTGEKTVETRGYELPGDTTDPAVHVLYETSPEGRGAVGVVEFKRGGQYKDKQAWKNDSQNHCVPETDKKYAWKDGCKKFKWEVSRKVRLGSPFKMPDDPNRQKQGARNHKYWKQNLAELPKELRDTVRKGLTELAKEPRE